MEMTVAFWVCTAITAISAYTSLGFSIAALRASSGTALINAHYALARSVALAVLSTVPLVFHANTWAIAAAIALILTQLGDGGIGATIHSAVKTYGPFFTALVNTVALVWLLTVL